MTCRKEWPQVEAVCASEPLALDDYIKSIGDEHLVIDMLVGDLQRIIEYPKLGFAITQHVPEPVAAAYDRLLAAGFDSRLLKGWTRGRADRRDSPAELPPLSTLAKLFIAAYG